MLKEIIKKSFLFKVEKNGKNGNEIRTGAQEK